MSVWSDRITANSAFWGIITGFAGNVFSRSLEALGWVDLPSYLNPILIGGVISLIVVLWVSRLGTVSDTERAHRLALHKIPAEECDAEQLKKSQWAAIGVAVFGVAVSALLLALYVFPYQAATGTLRDGQHLDWLTGEALAAAGSALLFVPLGIMTYKVIGRSYGTKEQPEARICDRNEDS
jgi:sodium/pantothenate symporter